MPEFCCIKKTCQLFINCLWNSLQLVLTVSLGGASTKNLRHNSGHRVQRQNAPARVPVLTHRQSKTGVTSYTLNAASSSIVSKRQDPVLHNFQKVTNRFEQFGQRRLAFKLRTQQWPLILVLKTTKFLALYLDSLILWKIPRHRICCTVYGIV